MTDFVSMLNDPKTVNRYRAMLAADLRAESDSYFTKALVSPEKREQIKQVNELLAKAIESGLPVELCQE